MDDDLDAADARSIEEHDRISTCPDNCAHCVRPGDCEDCLDCLMWPLPYPSDPWVSEPKVTGWHGPSHAEALARRRAELDLPDRVGLAVRSYRRQRTISQRGLAEQLGLAHSVVGRLERRAGSMPLGRVSDLLERLGYALVVVRRVPSVDESPGDHPVSDSTWGAPDLLAADAAGRRPPAHSRARWREELERLTGSDGLEHDGAWTWSMPYPWEYGGPDLPA